MLDRLKICLVCGLSLISFLVHCTPGSFWNMRMEALAAESDALGQVPPALGLEALWTMNGTMADSSGNNHLILGSTPAWGEGRFSEALCFDGKDDFADAGSSSFGLSNEVSISLWVKPNGLNTNRNSQVLIQRGLYVYPFMIRLEGNRPRACIRTKSGTNYLYGVESLTADAWNHLALTYSNGTMTLYVNGKPNSKSTLPGEIVTQSNQKTTLGMSPMLSNPFNGCLDEVRIYSRALAEIEIKTLLENGDTPPAPLPAPSNLSATAVSSSQIDLTWTDNSVNETGFTIQSSTDGLNFLDVAALSADATSFSIVGLSAGATYFFRVCAFNAQGVSAYTDSVNAITYSKSDREIALELITGNTFYLDAAQGDDINGNGTSTNPWKTLAKVQSVAKDGDGIFLRSGNYGAYVENTTGRAAWVSYINDVGHNPVITNISSRFNSSRNVYLAFYGVTVAPAWVNPAGDAAWQAAHPGSTDPQYAQSRQNTYMKTASPINALNSDHLMFMNCEIFGTNKHLTPYGVYLTSCNDVVIEGCHIYRVTRGIAYQNSARVSLLSNHIHNITSTFIGSGAYCRDSLIEGNNCYDSNWSKAEDWAPRALNQNYHASFISIRSSDVTVRNNIFHNGGTSSTIMLYDDPDCPAIYNNILIENNLLYDPQTQIGLRLNRVGNNIVVRNNILVGRKRYDVSAGPMQYGMVFTLSNVAAGHDGSGLALYNNIFVGMASFGEWYATVQEGGNIFWSSLTTPNGKWTFLPQGNIASGSKVITSQTGYAPDYFTNGFFNGELDFSWTWEGTDLILPHGHGKVIDFTYAPGSEAINFGNSEQQSSDSLGRVELSGFITKDGQNRDGNHHSAGCYEP